MLGDGWRRPTRRNFVLPVTRLTGEAAARESHPDSATPDWSLRERVRTMPQRLTLWLRGRRYQARPFQDWAPASPACVEGQADHEESLLAAAPMPAPEFFASIGAGHWQEAARLGRQPEPAGGEHRAAVSILRCPATSRLVAFAYLTESRSGPTRLLWQRILSPAARWEIAPYLDAWRPAVKDLLSEIRDRDRHLRTRTHSPPSAASPRSRARGRLFPLW